jgi:HK97 family phage major capsid protein
MPWPSLYIPSHRNGQSMSAQAIREQRDAVITENETLLAGDVTEDALATIEKNNATLGEIEARLATVDAAEKRVAELQESRKAAGVQAFGGAVVTKQELTYDRTLRNSYLKDMIGHKNGDRDATDRLQRHSKEVFAINEERKVPFAFDGEKRAISTAAAAGGDFSPPIYLLDDYAGFARAARVGTGLVTNMALPSGYSSIIIPEITTGTKAALQGGNNATITTRDAVTASVTATVQTIAGYEDVSIQLIEQSPLGGGIDRLVMGDLMADYALALNTAVVGTGAGTGSTLKGLVTLGTDTTNGIPTTWTETTPSAAGLLTALAKGESAVANNRFADVEAILMSASTWYWATQLIDSNGRPLVNLTTNAFNALGINGNPTAVAGLKGTIGGVPVYVDATMTKTYATNQAPILVGKFSDSYLFESGTKAQVFPDVGSATGTVRFRLYGYVALAHRFAKSVSAISGTGTVSPTGY